MGEARLPKVLAHRIGEAFVLAQDHSARQRRLAGTQAGLHSGLGAPPRAVEHPRESAPPGAGGAQRTREQHGVRPAAPLEIVDRPQREEAPAGDQLGPHRDRRP